MTDPRDFLLRLWNDKRAHPLHPIPFLLFLLSLLYRAVVQTRSLLFRVGMFQTYRLDCPVISIGNITVGGTGKTPTVMLLASILQAKGFKPAILSRGYGGKNRAPVTVVSDGRRLLAAPEEAGDEPCMMATLLETIPVLTGRKRFLTGQCAINTLGADILVLDDAFQHQQLARDINIVLLNANTPFGNGFLLPRGPLREPAQALRRADAVILTDVDSDAKKIRDRVQQFQTDFPGLPVLTASYQPRDLIRNAKELMPVTSLRDKKVFAFCGIANPESFRRALESAGANNASLMSFPDHNVLHSTRDTKDRSGQRWHRQQT